MNQNKLRFLGIFLIAEFLLLIASPLLGNLIPYLGVAAVWVWFILPGYLLTYLIKREISWFERIPLGFSFGVGFNAPFTIVAILLRMSLTAYLWLTIFTFILSAVVYYFWAPDPEKPVEKTSPELGSKDEKRLQFVLNVILAAIVVFLVFLALTWPPAGDDLAGLPLYTEVLAQDKIIGEEPFHGTGTPVTPRNELVVWGYQTILLAKLGDIDPAALLVGSRGVLIIISFLSVFSFIQQWFNRTTFTKFSLILWGLYLLGSTQYDGDGSNFVTRIFQDKFLGWFVIIPALMAIYRWYVDSGDRRILIMLTIGAFGTAMLHPVTFTILLILMASYALIHLIFQWSRQELMKFVWLGLVLLLCLVIPAVQYIRYSGPMPIELAGLDEAVDFSRYRLAIGRFRLFLLEGGGAVLHPKVITQQFVLFSLIASVFLVRDARNNRGVRLLLSSLILLTILLYFPLTAFLIGKFVTPFLIWRLAWPYSLLSILVLGLVSGKALTLIANRFRSDATVQSMMRFRELVLIVAAVLIALPNIQFGLGNLNERLASEEYAICNKAEGALSAVEELAAGGPVNLLAAQKLNLCIPGNIGLANVIEYRGLGTVNRLPFENFDANLQRVEDSDYFSNAIHVDDRILEIIDTYNIEYVFLSRDRLGMELQLRQIPETFELVYQDDEFDLFAVKHPLVSSKLVDGNTALRLRAWEDAAAIFNDVLASETGHAAAYMGLAEVYLGMGEIDKAVEALEDGVSFFPEEAVMHQRLAETYLIARTIEKAVDEYAIARDLAPERGDLYISLGTVQFIVGEETAALKNFEEGEAKYSKPGTAEYYAGIGNQLAFIRWYSQAAKYYEKAVAVDPHPLLYVDYSEVLIRGGEIEKAIEACKEAINLDSWYFMPYYQLGRIYQSQGDLAQAEILYRQALWLDPSDTTIYVDLAEVLQELVGVDNAVAEIEAYNRRNLALPGPPAGLIPLHIMKGDTQSALEEYNLLDSILPRSTSVEVSRGFLLVDTGVYDEAYSLFNDAVEDNPDLISPNMGLAKLYSLENDIQMEIEQRLMIAQQLPMVSWPHISLAIAYNRLGNWESAQDEFEFTVKLSPKWTEAHIALADFYRARGDWDHALDSYLKALELGATDPEILLKIGEVNWNKGDLDKAEEFFLKAIDSDPRYRPAYLELTRIYWQQGLAGDSMVMLDSLRDLGAPSLQEIGPLVGAYMMQGRVEEAANVYDVAISTGELFAEFHDWTNPELPFDIDQDYAIAVIQELEEEPISVSAVLRNAASFYISRGEFEKAEEVFTLNQEIAPEDPLEYVAMADFLAMRGKQAEVMETLSEGLQEFPESAEIYNKFGEIYLDQGEFDLAEESFGQALTVAPESSAAYLNLAEMYRARTEFSRAEDLLKDGWEKNPNSLDLLVALSSLYQFQGKMDLAEEALMTGYNQSPADAIVVMELALLNSKLGNYEQAEQLLGLAVSLEPSNGEVYLALGEFYDSRGITSKALLAYQTASNLNLGDLRPQMMLADFYRKSNDPASAKKVLLAAIESQPGNPAPYVSLGNLSLLIQELDEAYTYYQQACAIDKSNIECILGQGQVLLEKEELEPAIEVFGKALEKSPSAREAFISLAQAYQLEGDNEQADLMYELAIDSSLDKPNAYLSRADYNYLGGNFSSAESDYNSARKYWPGSVSVGLEVARFYKQQNKLSLSLEILESLADIYTLTCSIGNEIGDIYTMQLDWENATQIYQSVLDVDPRCVDAYQGLAKAKQSMGESEGVLDIYEDAVATASDIPSSYTNLGNAYSNRMDYQKAVTSFQEALDIDPNNLGALLGLEKTTLIQFEGEEFPYLSLDQVQEGISPEYLVTFALFYQDYNQWDKAYEYIERVLEIDKNNPEVWHAMGNHYAHLLDWDAAQGAYQVALHYQPDSLEVLLALGEVQLELELVQEAKATFQKVINYHPGKADGYLALAELYISEELREEAVDMLRTGIDNAPSDSRLYEALGRYYINQREFGLVEAIYEEGLENIPGAPNLHAATGDYLSWGINGLVQEIQQAEATIWWYGYLIRRLESFEGPFSPNQKKAFANRTLEINHLYQAAVAELNAAERELEFAQDDVDAARAAYEEALRLNPGNETALLGLAKLEQELGSTEIALEYYRRAVAANSNSVVALNRLGFAYIEYGYPKSALPIFERSISLDPDEILSLAGRFRALIEINEWGVVEGARITDSAQFWWGNLIDRMRFSAFEGTNYNPNSGPQEKLDFDQAVSIEVDVPVSWSRVQTYLDYSVVTTYTSPDENAAIQVVVFEDNKQVSRELALQFALVMLDETYTDNLDITANQILEDRENLIWEAVDSGYHGVTGFTINNGSIVVMTYMYEDQAGVEYGNLLEDIANRVDLGDPIYR